MVTNSDLQPLFEAAIDDAGTWVRRAATASLRTPTPCAEWDLGALLGHMVAQNDGFAAAVRDGDAPLSAYAPPTLAPAEVLERWSDSAQRLRAAFRAAPGERMIRLAELDGEVPVTMALGLQIVDCAVHAWDIATTLEEHYRPEEAIVQVVLASARMIAARPGGAPGFFAPPREVTEADPWLEALALLGR